MGIEVLYHHEGHSVLGRQMPQQFHGRFESARRPAHTDNRAGWIFFVICSLVQSWPRGLRSCPVCLRFYARRILLRGSFYGHGGVCYPNSAAQITQAVNAGETALPWKPEGGFSCISHAVLLECDASSHRFSMLPATH